MKIDAANGRIVLLGERDFLARGLNLRDFAMALWLVFGPHPQDPAFSLDPDDTRNPQGPWLRARYIPDMLQDIAMVRRRCSRRRDTYSRN